MGVPYRIRPATRGDVDSIAAAEKVCFSDPWSRGSLDELFDSETVVGLVAEAGRTDFRLAGYIFARVIAGEAEILNIAVLPEFRSAGIGRDLLVDCLGRLQAKGAVAAFLEVRESNESAKRLYGRRGFRPVGVRTDYYRKPRENALILRLDLESMVN
jgi:[ribosomal protein S18]-alanine N-acetyltransferase